MLYISTIISLQTDTYIDELVEICLRLSTKSLNACNYLDDFRYFFINQRVRFALFLLVALNEMNEKKESIFLFSRYECRGLGPS